MKSEFITLSREDAENLYSMIFEAVERLYHGDKSDDVVAVFGPERSISYERLIDKLYPVYKDFEQKELINPEINVHKEEE